MARLVLSDWLYEQDRQFEALEQRLLASGAPLWKMSGAGHGPTHRLALVSGDVAIDVGLFPGTYWRPLTDTRSGTVVARYQDGTVTVYTSRGAWQKQGFEDWRMRRAGPVSGLLPPESEGVAALEAWSSGW